MVRSLLPQHRTQAQTSFRTDRIETHGANFATYSDRSPRQCNCSAIRGSISRKRCVIPPPYFPSYPPIGIVAELRIHENPRRAKQSETLISIMVK